MSRGVFSSHNKVGETWSFQTNITDATTFDPIVQFSSGSDRVSWNLGAGGSYVAGNSLSYTYLGDTGATKTITIRTNRLSKLTHFRANEDDVSGHVDFTGWDHMSFLELHDNPSMTGITNTPSVNTIGNYEVDNSQIPPGGLVGTLDVSMLSLGGRFFAGFQPLLTKIDHGSTTQSGGWVNYWIRVGNLTGNHDMSMFTNLGGDFQIFSHNNLTGVTHTSSPAVFTEYYLYSNDITGNHDLSMLTGLGGVFKINNNSNLTSITHTASTQVFTEYSAAFCELTGNLDLSMFPNLGGSFWLFGNNNLTGITHTISPEVFTYYDAAGCGLTGNHDLSMFPNLGGIFRIYGNNNLTGITHTASTQVFTVYYADNCDLTGNHDLSMFPNLGGELTLGSNDNLTSITHTASTEVFTYYNAADCNLIGNHDLSMLTGLGGVVLLMDNNNLTSISFPLTTQTFENFNSSANGRALSLHDCDLDYVNFLPLSGATMDVGSTWGASIGLEDNLMGVIDVNHILVDFLNMATIYNPTGWNGVTLNISGTNASPDTTSGGFNGLAAITVLTNGTNNWSISYS